MRLVPAERFRPWEPEEADELLRMRAHGLSYRQIAGELKRSKHEVQIQIERTSYKTSVRWEPDEDARLAALLAEGWSDDVIAIVLDRSASAVRVRQRVLRLPSERRRLWSIEEHAVAEQMWQLGFSRGQIAAKIGRSKAACAQYMARVGITENKQRRVSDMEKVIYVRIPTDQRAHVLADKLSGDDLVYWAIPNYPKRYEADPEGWVVLLQLGNEVIGSAPIESVGDEDGRPAIRWWANTATIHDPPLPGARLGSKWRGYTYG